MSTGSREDEGKTGKRGRTSSTWSGPAARVRQLLARMEESHEALQRLTRAAEQHLTLLTPRLALLDATPFGGLPDVLLESPEPAPEQARAKRTFEFPDLSVSRRASAAPVPAAPSATEPAHGGKAAERAAHTTRSTPTLRLSAPRTRQRADLPAGGPAQKLPLASPAAASTSRATTDIGPLSEHTTTPAVAQTTNGRVVDLASLVERVLRERGKSAHSSTAPRAESLSRSTAADPSHFSLQERGSREHLSALEQPSTLLPGRDAFRIARASARHTTGADLPMDSAGTTHARPAGFDAVQRQADPPFIFDPLEPRPEIDDSDETLTERINEVLREQARRQGVDLT